MKKLYLFAISMMTVLVFSQLASAGWVTDLILSGITGRLVAPPNTCIDTDQGRDYITFGSTSVCNGITGDTSDEVSLQNCVIHADACIDSNRLSENYCSGSVSRTLKYTCKNGCSEGACVQYTCENLPARSSIYFDRCSTGYQIEGACFDRVTGAFQRCTTAGGANCIGTEKLAAKNLNCPLTTPDACTDEYIPVCGQPPMLPCLGMGCGAVMPPPKTYPNICKLEAAGATLIHGGACTAACTDSDGGLNYYEKGTLSGPGISPDTATDDCVTLLDGRNVLVERFCIGTEDYDCPYGCKDGACIKSCTVDARGCSGLNYPEIMCGNTGHEYVWNGHNNTVQKVCKVQNTPTVGSTWSFEQPGCATLSDSNCVPTTKCTDSDVGKDYYVKGTCADATYPSGITDLCYTTDQVTYDNIKELFCNADDECQAEIIKCPFGCVNGACTECATTSDCAQPSCYQQPCSGGVLCRNGKCVLIEPACVEGTFRLTDLDNGIYYGIEKCINGVWTRV